MIVEKIYIKDADDYDRLFGVIPEYCLSRQLVGEIKQRFSRNIQLYLLNIHMLIRTTEAHIMDSTPNDINHMINFVTGFIFLIKL